MLFWFLFKDSISVAPGTRNYRAIWISVFSLMVVTLPTSCPVVSLPVSLLHKVWEVGGCISSTCSSAVRLLHTLQEVDQVEIVVEIGEGIVCNEGPQTSAPIRNYEFRGGKENII